MENASATINEPSEIFPVNTSALMPSISSDSFVKSLPSSTRNRNSLKASAALSVPMTPVSRPVSIIEKNWAADAPPLANWVENSLILSRKSSP